MPTTTTTPTRRALFSFTGTAADLRRLTWDWVQIDSKITRTVWDYDPAKRIWRRRTNRNGR